MSPVRPEPTHHIVPVVSIFCTPKFGDIFVPAIAAEVFTSAFTIAPLMIFALATELFASSLAPIESGAISIAAIELSIISLVPTDAAPKSSAVIVASIILALATLSFASSLAPIASAAISIAATVLSSISVDVIVPSSISDESIVPSVISSPLIHPHTASVPVIFTFHVTSNFSDGEVVPIPTLPDG